MWWWERHYKIPQIVICNISILYYIRWHKSSFNLDGNFLDSWFICHKEFSYVREQLSNEINFYNLMILFDFYSNLQSAGKQNESTR